MVRGGQPGRRERRIIGTAEARAEQLIIERNLLDRRATAGVVVAAAIDTAGVAIDVAHAPLDLSKEIVAGVIFEVETPLPILAARALRFFEQATVRIVVGVRRVETDQIEPGNVARGADDEIDRMAAVECVPAQHVIDALGRAGEGADGPAQVGGYAKRSMIPPAAGCDLVG